MNKKALLIIIIIVGLFIAGGGAFAYVNTQKSHDKMTMDKQAMDADIMSKEDDTMSKDAMMSDHGSYITLDEFNKDPAHYADSKKVYFFHANWCPICQSINKEIEADPSKIPAGVTLIKTDFDSSTTLRKQYGVTTQYTFVQVDNSGNETAQWSATSLDAAIAGIKS